MPSDSTQLRDRMVRTQISSRRVMDERVLDSMRTVPHEEFVPVRLREMAFEDAPLPIEEGQTISQPYIVAVMAEALELTPRDRVLEIGAGSGYAAAVLSRIASKVHALERHPVLSRLAAKRMERHNSHVGNAAATEMGAQGELNIGQLARGTFGQQAVLVGFGTDRGTVAAASNWDEPVQVMEVRPAHEDSYERICQTTRLPAFVLPLREPRRDELREALVEPHLERAIGVIYRPENELLSHYFQASLPAQFDEYVWLEETTAVHPLAGREGGGSSRDLALRTVR